MDASLHVADRIQSVRLEKNLTLGALSTLCGLSAAYLSRVENHCSAITIAGLNKVADALGVSMKDFFADAQSPRLFELCRAGAGQSKRLTGRRGVTVEMLAENKRGKLMEPFVAVLPAKADGGKLPHSGEEFNYVLAGSCTLLYGEESIPLEVGDSVYYDASVPHQMKPRGHGPCRILAICTSRDYLFHGDINRLLGKSNA